MASRSSTVLRFGAATLCALSVGRATALAQTPPGHIVRLERLSGGSAVQPQAISGDGLWIVGSAHGGSDWQAVVWSALDGSVAVPSDSVGSVYTSISADGLTIGGSHHYGAAIWRNGARSSLGVTGSVYALSDGGEYAVGEGYGPHDSSEAFLWSSQRGVVWLGGAHPGYSSSAHDVSADGRAVVGLRQNNFGSVTGFLWTEEGGMVDLQSSDSNERMVRVTELCEGPGLVFGSARLVNTGEDSAAYWGIASERITRFKPLDEIETFGILIDVTPTGRHGVGWSRTGNTDRATIWDLVRGVRSLQDVASEQYGVDLTWWLMETGAAISDDGATIVGTGWYGGFAAQGFALHLPRPVHAPPTRP